jgi:fermentation-respiration switch protein FrsA (DUF1100 family)
MSTKKGRKKRGCRYWFNLLAVGLVGFLVLSNAGYIGLIIYWLTEPVQRPVCCTTPADLGLEYEAITLTTTDGLRLAGWYIPSQNRAAVILLHGYGNNRLEMLPRAEILARHGYGVLLYDERASGESEGEYRSFGWADVADVPQALAFLQGRAEVDPDRIGILGFSIGGQIALQAAAQNAQIRAVVAEEPGFARLRDLPPLPSLRDKWLAFNYSLTFLGIQWRTGVQPPAGIVADLDRIPPRPVFFIATGPTKEASYWLVRHYYDLAGEPKLWWHVPEAEHGYIPSLRPEEYETRIVAFFDEALLK